MNSIGGKVAASFYATNGLFETGLFKLVLHFGSNHFCANLPFSFLSSTYVYCQRLSLNDYVGVDHHYTLLLMWLFVTVLAYSSRI